MADHISKTLGSLKKTIRERRLQEKSPTAETPELTQLSTWPEPVRGVPNSILRGALFLAIQGKNRRHVDHQLPASQGGIQIRFTGMQFAQSDLDVWEQALHLARWHPLGTQCDFSAHAFLKAIGRNNGKTQHEWLKKTFTRLTGTVVEITHDNRTYFGSLIEGGVRDELTGRYVINLNPKLSKLYQAGWTAIDWEQRQQLQRKPLALWLHGFLASHAQPYPLRVESLMAWSGSRTKEVWTFKQNLKAALNELKGVGAINDYEFSTNLVTIERTPSGTQKRYLAYTKPKKKLREARHTR